MDLIRLAHSFSEFLQTQLSEVHVVPPSLYTTLLKIAKKVSSICKDVSKSPPTTDEHATASGTVLGTKVSKMISSCIFMLHAFGISVHLAEMKYLKTKNLMQDLRERDGKDDEIEHQDAVSKCAEAPYSALFPEETSESVEGLMGGFSKLTTNSHAFLKYVAGLSDREKIARGLDVPEKILRELKNTWFLSAEVIIPQCSRSESYFTWKIRRSITESPVANAFDVLCGSESSQDKDIEFDIFQHIQCKISIHSRVLSGTNIKSVQSASLYAPAGFHQQKGVQCTTDDNISLNSCSKQVLHTPSPRIRDYRNSIVDEIIPGRKRSRDSLRLEETVLSHVQQCNTAIAPHSIFKLSVKFTPPYILPEESASEMQNTGPIHGSLPRLSLRALKIQYQLSNNLVTFPPNTITLPMNIPIDALRDNGASCDQSIGFDTLKSGRGHPGGNSFPSHFSIALPLCIESLINETLLRGPDVEVKSHSDDLTPLRSKRQRSAFSTAQHPIPSQQKRGYIAPSDQWVCTLLSARIVAGVVPR